MCVAITMADPVYWVTSISAQKTGKFVITNLYIHLEKKLFLD